MMNNKSNALTLILCGLTCIMGFPVLADDSRDDHRKQGWRSQHDNRSFENTRNKTKENCSNDKDCINPVKRDNSKNYHQEKVDQERTRQEKTSHAPIRPAPRIITKEPDQPTTRVEKRNQDQPTMRTDQRRDPDRSTTRPVMPEMHDARRRPVKPVNTVTRPKLRMTYSDHIPRDYRYIRGPWYNTRYIAPLPIHFHRIGYRLNVLPRAHTRIIIGGFPYFYFSGIFYRPYGSSYIVVSAPIGAFVETLPVGFIAFTISLSTYYYVNDTYYFWDENREGYRVVAKPAGAEEAIENTTAGRLMVYPNKGQSEEQQAKDRYECHRWAVNESGIDPSLEEQEFDAQDNDLYRRAIAACLEGHDYTVK
jgi:hypothetical protein